MVCGRKFLLLQYQSNAMRVPLRPRTNSSNGSATPAQRICYTRTTDRGQFFEAAARILAAPRTSADDVVHLNSVYSHDGVSRSGARTSD